MERQRAARLVVFLPSVYCRIMLRKSGAQFSASFRRLLAEGISPEKPLSSEPVWDEAMLFANREIERGISSQDILLIAARSAEFDAANQLLNQGSKLEDISFTALVLNFFDEDRPKKEDTGWIRSLGYFFNSLVQRISGFMSRERR